MNTDSAIQADFIERWQKRIVEDIEGIRDIKVELLKLAAGREDTELAEIANRLHLARCRLVNTITLRFGSDELPGIQREDCGESVDVHDG